MTSQQIIDAHAHVYPAGCFAEVIKSRADFKLVEGCASVQCLTAVHLHH
jgi:hypothetical protein